MGVLSGEDARAALALQTAVSRPEDRGPTSSPEVAQEGAGSTVGRSSPLKLAPSQAGSPNPHVHRA